MHPLTKLWRADETRATRFHTSNGRLCLDPLDLVFALATTLLRRVSGRRVAIPWIALPAYRYLRDRVRGARVFEFGSGMSTVWFARRCRELHSVEHDPGWYRRVRSMTAAYPDADVRLCERKEDYVGRIDAFPAGHFDVILIDGVWRGECFARCVSRVKAGGLLVVDNTDAETGGPVLPAVRSAFPGAEIVRHAGFPPGSLHPVETTVVRIPR